MRVMEGETVLVAVKSQSGNDRFNNAVESWAEPVAVDHVLVTESTEDDQVFTRPEGIVSVYTLSFRHDCDLEMRGAKVTVRVASCWWREARPTGPGFSPTRTT